MPEATKIIPFPNRMQPRLVRVHVGACDTATPIRIGPEASQAEATVADGDAPRDA